MTTPEQREKFEDWYADNNLKGVNVETWAAWQAALSAAPRVSGDWKLVPVEPTKEMIEAAESVDIHPYQDTKPYEQLIFDAMIAAAPTPPEVSGLREVSGVEEVKELAAESGKRTLALLSTPPEQDLHQREVYMDEGWVPATPPDHIRDVTKKVCPPEVEPLHTSPSSPKAAYDSEGNPLNLLAAAKDLSKAVGRLPLIIGAPLMRVNDNLRKFIKAPDVPHP